MFIAHKSAVSDEGDHISAAVFNFRHALLGCREASTRHCGGAGGTQDHDATGEPDGNSGANGDLHGGSWGNRPARLLVAEERLEHCRGHDSELHDTGGNDFK